MKKEKVAPVQLNIQALPYLMTVITLIASWHITDIWSGIVAMLCGLVTIWIVAEEIKVYGKPDSGRKRKRKTF